MIGLGEMGEMEGSSLFWGFFLEGLRFVDSSLLALLLLLL